MWEIISESNVEAVSFWLPECKDGFHLFSGSFWQQWHTALKGSMFMHFDRCMHGVFLIRVYLKGQLYMTLGSISELLLIKFLNQGIIISLVANKFLFIVYCKTNTHNYVF